MVVSEGRGTRYETLVMLRAGSLVARTLALKKYLGVLGGRSSAGDTVDGGARTASLWLG